MSTYAAIANLANRGSMALIVVFLIRVAGFDSVAVGLLMATTGVGGTAGAMIARRVAGRLGTAHVAAVHAGSGVFALLIPLTGPGPGDTFYIVGLFMLGAGGPPATSSSSTLSLGRRVFPRANSSSFLPTLARAVPSNPRACDSCNSGECVKIVRRGSADGPAGVIGGPFPVHDRPLRRGQGGQVRAAGGGHRPDPVQPGPLQVGEVRLGVLPGVEDHRDVRGLRGRPVAAHTAWYRAVT
jgi:hypothetical protein